MNEDTTQLLKECNSGCKMAIESMEQVEGKIQDSRLKGIIDAYKDKHEQIQSRTAHLLWNGGEKEKEPGAMASAMSKMSTGIKMAYSGGSHQAAKIMMDGCNMGIQSICEYENDYGNASEEAKEIAHSLVKMEKEFMAEMEQFL